jgi:hypothetical protein
MPHTPQSIVNLACVELGAGSVTSTFLTAPINDRERKFAQVYPQARDAELRKRRWNFAKKELTLTVDPLLSHPDYPYGYALPDECLRPLRPKGETWALAGRTVFTHHSTPFKLWCIARVAESLFDVLFVDVLKFRIAQDMITDRTQSNTIWQKVETGYRDAVLEAGRANAFERGPEEPPLGDWVTSRFI